MTMAMNKIQFQAGMSVHEFLRHYGTEEQCEAALFTSRWPQGWKCCAAMGSVIPVPITVVDYGNAWIAVISVLQL